MRGLVALVAVVGCGGPRTVDQIPTSALPDPVSFPLRLIRSVAFVQVQVDDGPPAWFALDTGAPISVIDTRLAGRVTKHVTDAAVSVNGTTPGSFETSQFSFDGLRLAGVRLDDVAGIVTDLSAIGDRVGIPLGGILGFSAFEQRLLTLDYPGARGSVAPGELPLPDGVQVLRYVVHENHPAIPLRVGELDVIAELDSGSGYMMELAQQLMARVPVHGAPVVIGHAIGLTGISAVQGVRLDAHVGVGAYTLADPIVFFGDDPSLNTDRIGRLGGPWLASFAVTFDQRNRVVRFARASHEPITSPAETASGLEMLRQDGHWRVASFGNDTVAKLVEIGDVLVSVDGKSADDFDSGDWQRRNRDPRPMHVVVDRAGQRHDVDVPIATLVP